MHATYQVGVMQELNSSDPEDAANVPRTIEVEMTEDLVSSCSAGDVITVLGLVKVMSTDTRRGKSCYQQQRC